MQDAGRSVCGLPDQGIYGKRELPQKMEQDQEPLVFPHNLIKMGKDLFARFKKAPALTIPAGAAIVGTAFYLLLTYMMDSCLATIIPPFLMLAVFWLFGIKKARMLVIAGVVTCTVLMLVEAFFFVGVYTGVEPGTAFSDDDGMLLTDGTVSPLRGDDQTVFNYTITVHVNESTPISNISVVIIGLDSWSNESMLPGPRNDTLAQFYYSTTIANPINQYVFWANVNGTWYLAADYIDGVEAGVIGPVHSSTWEIAKPMLYYSAIQAYVQFFLIYVLLVGMIWWTRRARRMRETQLEKWQAKQVEAAAQTPKDEAKVPSLSKAMGLETDDSFVCSECGADVPADAKECPKCGEKFE